AEDDQEVEPARPTVLDELAADSGGVEGGFGEEHHSNAPFQAASGVDRIAQDVGREPCAEDWGGLLAEGPGRAGHGRSPRVSLLRSERTSLRGPSACGFGHAIEPVDGAYL